MANGTIILPDGRMVEVEHATPEDVESLPPEVRAAMERMQRQAERIRNEVGQHAADVRREQQQIFDRLKGTDFLKYAR